MNTIRDTAPKSYQFGGAVHQMLFNNTDNVQNLVVQVNGDPVGFTIEAGGKRGWRFNKGIYAVVLTGTATFEITGD